VEEEIKERTLSELIPSQGDRQTVVSELKWREDKVIPRTLLSQQIYGKSGFLINKIKFINSIWTSYRSDSDFVEESLIFGGRN